MSLSAAITHLTSAVHAAGQQVAVLGEGNAAKLVERLEKQSGRRRAMWDTGGAVDDGEGGATTNRWRVAMTLRVAFVLTPDEQAVRRQATVVMANLASAIRDAVLDAAAATAAIVSLECGGPRPEPGVPAGAMVMALPVTMRIRGPL